MIGDSEWGVLIGELSDRETIGFSYQGDLIANLGLLAELNWSQPDDQDDHRFQGVIGFDHRWSNTLHWQLEYYRNGYGSSQREDYPGLILSTRPVGYLGRDYTAFAVNYEWTPLLMTNFLWLQNWNDRSGSATINTLISLSDEAELVFNLGMPYGSAGSGGSGASEYGLAPNSLFIEYRHYF